MLISLQDVISEVQSRRVESSQDYVLKKYLKRLSKFTDRVTILYASAFTEKEAAGRVLQINRQDASCLMAAASEMQGRELDLILHSPGGSVEAVEQIMSYLRRRFEHIRVIVPLCALSTATLLCCAADRIVLADHSALGPIDPVVNWAHQGESYSATAQTIINEYSIAQRNINNKRNDPALWIERLKSFPPGLLATCKSQIQVSQSLAQRWLERYMLRGEEAAAEKAESIAAWLADSRRFMESLRPIGLSDAVSKGLKAERLDDDEKLLENVMAVFYAGVLKFQTGDCVKIVENHNGKGCTFAARSAAVSS
jgi:ATP-dependent protease ClpP protease subunit